MALWTMAFIGSTVIGGPIIGWVGQSAGPRWGLVVGAAAAVAAGGIGVRVMRRRSREVVSTLPGSVPVSTLGGLKGRGNPLGATGVYQIVEAALQLRGEAGANQVDGARRALVQSLGGPAATAVAHVLEV